MLRIGFLRASQVFLISGLLLASGQSVSAQSVAKAPSQAPQAIQPTPERVIKLADVVKKVEDEGRSISIRNYIAEDVGIKGMQIDSSPVQARALDDTQRELCVIDDTGALLFMTKDGDTTVVYLANHTGVLQLAGYFSPGRLRSQNFKGISKEKAAAGFAAEKEFWIKKTANPKFSEAVKPEEHVSKPDTAKSAAAPMPQEPQDGKSTQKSLRTAPASSKQQSDTDATPKKKRISWF